jgi:hypothetical protein
MKSVFFTAFFATSLLTTAASAGTCGQYIPCGTFTGPLHAANAPSQPLLATETLKISRIAQGALRLNAKLIKPDGTLFLDFVYDLHFAKDGKFAITEKDRGEVGNGSCKGVVCVYAFYPSENGSAVGGFTVTKAGLIRTQLNHWADGTIDLFEAKMTR